jgi:hypothetical protein
LLFPAPQVLEDLQQRIALLQARPTVLDEFMAYQVGVLLTGREGLATLHL